MLGKRDSSLYVAITLLATAIEGETALSFILMVVESAAAAEVAQDPHQHPTEIVHLVGISLMRDVGEGETVNSYTLLVLRDDPDLGLELEILGVENVVRYA